MTDSTSSTFHLAVITNIYSLSLLIIWSNNVLDYDCESVLPPILVPTSLLTESPPQGERRPGEPFSYS